VCVVRHTAESAFDSCLSGLTNHTKPPTFAQPAASKPVACCQFVLFSAFALIEHNITSVTETRHSYVITLHHSYYSYEHICTNYVEQEFGLPLNFKPRSASTWLDVYPMHTANLSQFGCISQPLFEPQPPFHLLSTTARFQPHLSIKQNLAPFWHTHFLVQLPAACWPRLSGLLSMSVMLAWCTSAVCFCAGCSKMHVKCTGNDHKRRA